MSSRLIRSASVAFGGRRRAGAAAACALGLSALLAGTAGTAQAALSDEAPSEQAVAAHAEFLSQVPAPPGGAGAVCVIDSGVSLLPDLQQGQVTTRTSIRGDDMNDALHTADPLNPSSGHGSFVAGVIAGAVDGQGSAGIWPASRIISVRVYDGGAPPTIVNYVDGISRCLMGELGPITAINISISATGIESPTLSLLEDRVSTARRRGVNVVAAAGNSAGPVDYPAAAAGVFGIGAVNAGGARCAFSNHGAALDLYAPGCDVGLTAFDGMRTQSAGTSFAAPVVTASLNALRSYRPDLSPQAAERLLIDSADMSAAGPALNVAAAFRNAGLGYLVDSYAPAPTSRPLTSPPTSPPVTAPPVEMSLPPNAQPPASNVSVRSRAQPRRGAADMPSKTATRIPSKPRLRGITHRNHRLVVRVRVRHMVGDRTVFRLDGRRFVRREPLLDVNSRSWRRVSVTTLSRAGRSSAPLIVRNKTRR